MKSNILVIIQFGMIFAIFGTGPLLANNLWLRAIEISGVLLGLWAIQAMRIGNFNVRPIVKEEGKFINRGPYKLIRHPMYSAIFFTQVPLIIDYFTWYRLAFIMILFINLCIKCRFEEGLLLKHFSEYEEYMKRTKRIIPFVY